MINIRIYIYIYVYIYIYLYVDVLFQETTPGCKNPVDVASVSESSLRTMSGNGMSIPCAGFVLLMAVLFVEDFF